MTPTLTSTRPDPDHGYAVQMRAGRVVACVMKLAAAAGHHMTHAAAVAMMQRSSAQKCHCIGDTNAVTAMPVRGCSHELRAAALRW